MEHMFNVEIAKEYGILPAILLQNLHYWITKNKANEKHFYDGRYWTYNSIRAFCELFPYASDKQIRNALNKLKDEGLIVVGNYNKSSYDRTLWYAITEKGKSILLKRQMDLTKEENGNNEKGEPIPNNKPDIKPNNKPNKVSKVLANGEIVNLINETIIDEELKQTIYDFIKMRNAIKKPMTTRAVHMLLNKLKKMSNNIIEQKMILEQSILKCWQDIYPLSEEEKNKIQQEDNKKQTNSPCFSYAFTGKQTNEEYRECLILHRTDKDKFIKKLFELEKEGKVIIDKED